MGMDALRFMTPAPASASIPVSLRRQFPDASFVGCAEIVVSTATDRSGDCTPGCLFAALPGTNVHGCAFVAEAVERGAAAILTETPLPDVRACQCIVPDARAAYSELCHALAAWPSRRLGVVGVTGTNGKTSVAWLVRSLLSHAGHPTGLAGTVEYSDRETSVPASLTTPDPRTLVRWMASSYRNDCTHFALEVSSHALDQRRITGLQLDAAIVTNITHDHLDYHGDYDCYRAAKRRIARHLKRGGRLILNLDDPGSASLLGDTPTNALCLTFAIDAEADVRAQAIECTPGGTRFTLTAGIEEVTVETPLIGRHNVSNCLAAASAGLHFGLSLTEIAQGIAALAEVPGRMQRVDCGQSFRVLVDYAHTPDALCRAIQAVRETTSGRVICLFGAGGDRDRRKRPEMGRAGAQADLVVVTSDNPRSEDPQTIIYDILTGCVAAKVHVDPDRERAIAWALREARAGDTVLVAGKGHEKEQVIGRDRIPFDDVAMCRKYLALRDSSPHIPILPQLVKSA
ncbi:MAG: UDP-N-acetylmuramoyl-L-alanyl-D-glutamate--2,6-diaminopimelate ligase [Planctomycetaceae bacterium]|nr:UDP-N-acetylmuramoyl-L-alanyl-D-glutamate--2,6-diaminopimelate ligase [Planctomycetaceae bacterium]